MTASPSLEAQVAVQVAADLAPAAVACDW